MSVQAGLDLINVVYICPVSYTVTGYEFHCGCHCAYVRTVIFVNATVNMYHVCVTLFTATLLGLGRYGCCVLPVKVLLLLPCIL